MGKLQAVPDEPSEIDLSEFDSHLRNEDHWRKILGQLSADDQIKLRAALVADHQITASSISSWFERRGITVHRATVTAWRSKRYATTA